jgi:hypothetical protein
MSGGLVVPMIVRCSFIYSFSKRDPAFDNTGSRLILSTPKFELRFEKSSFSRWSSLWLTHRVGAPTTSLFLRNRVQVRRMMRQVFCCRVGFLFLWWCLTQLLLSFLPVRNSVFMDDLYIWTHIYLELGHILDIWMCMKSDQTFLLLTCLRCSWSQP